MIDDPATVERLMGLMQAHLPIPAHPTSDLARLLRQRGARTGPERVLFGRRVLYPADEGGIACDVTPTRDAQQAWGVSLTHLRIPLGHPLAREIRAYQWECVRRIAGIGLPEPLHHLGPDGWSPRIAEEHHPVHRVLPDRIALLQARSHY